jgi:hypothetical protein
MLPAPLRRKQNKKKSPFLHACSDLSIALVLGLTRRSNNHGFFSAFNHLSDAW